MFRNIENHSAVAGEDWNENPAVFLLADDLRY